MASSGNPKMEPGAMAFVHADDAASTLRLHLAGMGLVEPPPSSSSSGGYGGFD